MELSSERNGVQNQKGYEAAADPRMPQVFHVGPPRTGTTWLYEVLKGRMNLPKPYKETDFFSANYGRGLDWYLAHFDDGLAARPYGEIEPDYFCEEDARRRIKQHAPGARIMCTFRDPVDRAFSYYRLKLRWAGVRCTFEEAWHELPEMEEASRYGHHLQRWLAAFGRDNVLVLFYEDLQRDPQAYVDRVCDCAGVKRLRLPHDELKRVVSSEAYTIPANYYWTRIGMRVSDWIHSRQWSGVTRAVAKLRLGRLFLDRGKPARPVSPATARRIRERFREEIEQLEAITGRDLSHWKAGAHSER